ncbi:MAG: STAS domain-containing protein [Planctomycetes bacterium]|nr:STAS domain-containing protein [Planctomycetota bacterium]MBL7044665.1 STAS domain-containing protein [Pirellulaceae bacterium]
MFGSKKQGAVHVVTGCVCLDHETVEDAREIFDQCAAQGQPRVVFDMEAIPLVDSSGLELLLDAQDHCRSRAGALRLAAPNQLCRDILVATSVADDFEIYDDVLTAVGSYAL